MLDRNDPRKPGMICWSGYWRDSYQVQAMWSVLRGHYVWMRVMWSDGHETNHCTPWDHRRDKILGVSEATA